MEMEVKWKAKARPHCESWWQECQGGRQQGAALRRNLHDRLW